MIVECIIELNSLCKHIKKGRKKPTSHSCTEFNKTQFSLWVSLNISFLASNIFYLFLFGALSLKHLVFSYYSNQIFIPTAFPANNGFGEDVFIKTNISVLVIRLQKTSSEDLLVKTNIFVLAMRLQDLFKTLWRRLQDGFSQWTHLRQFAIDSTSKFHVQSSWKPHRFWKANPRGNYDIDST